MCNTPWCAGECDDCKIDEELRQEYENSNSSCPYRKECNWITVGVKNDKCTTCGQTYTYS